MFGIEYNAESEEWILKSKQNFKNIFREFGSKTSFLQMFPKEDASTSTMRKNRQVLQTHLALTECVSFIELVGITDLDLVSKVRVKTTTVIS